MSNRWERLLDTKPIPIQEHLLDEVARLLEAELRGWPLNVEELDVATGRGFVDFLSAETPRPPKEVFPRRFVSPAGSWSGPPTPSTTTSETAATNRRALWRRGGRRSSS